MTGFEQYLIENGWLKFRLNLKTMRYEKAVGHELSTMTNITHHYFHETDKEVLSKIDRGVAVGNGGISYADRKNEIVFGLHEVGNPPTLIRPRPRLRVRRKRNSEIVIEDETLDANMHVALEKINEEIILTAMFTQIVIAIDLTDANH
jgi:hypothetical protein